MDRPDDQRGGVVSVLIGGPLSAPTDACSELRACGPQIVPPNPTIVLHVVD